MLTFLLVGCSFFAKDELAALKAEVLSESPTVLAVVSVGGAAALPPLRPGELAPPTGAPTSGLLILGVAPNGEGADPSQVAVVFDRPMVALDAIDATSGQVPIRCEPAIDGRFRWAGTSTAVVIPTSGAFPNATSFSCEVPQGTAALDGTQLESTVSWTFTTERPAVEATRPTEGSDQWDPKDPIVLRFNQAVEPEQVARAVHLVGENGREVALKFSRGQGKQDRPDVVLARGGLTPDTAYMLTLDAGLRGTEGALGLAEAHQVNFRTYPPLRVDTVGPTASPVSPLDPLEIAFTSTVDAKEVNKRVHIAPAPPDGFTPAETYESERWSWWGRLAPRTTYTVTLDAGVVDVHGQKLTDGRVWSFTTGDLPAMLDAPEGHQVYPANNPLSLPIRYRNVSSVAVSVEALDPRAIATAGNNWSDANVATGPTQASLPPGPNANKIAIGTVDLSPWLSAGGHGIIGVRTTAPEVRDWSGTVSPSVAILQVTDLGTTLKLAPDGMTTWVTRLSDGSPVADAEVEAVLGGRTVWTGRTGPDGLAVAKGDIVPDEWSSWREPLWVIVRSADDVALTSHTWDQGLDGWSHGVWSRFAPEDERLTFASFTDRGVYRPGDVAHVQVLMRQESLTGLGVPKDRALAWEHRDANGQVVSKGTDTADQNGSFSMDITLPTEGALGEHVLEVRCGEDRTFVWIPVKAYRAPAFRVDVSAPSTALAGGSLTATAQGRYLFGAAMKGASAKWSVGRQPLTLSPDGWEEFSFEVIPDMSEWSDRPGYESVSSGSGTLDAGGRLLIVQPLPAESVKVPWTYSVETEVTDTDRQQLANRTTVDVHVAESYVGVRTPAGLGNSGNPVVVEVVRVTPQGEPRPGPVTLEAYRRTWDVVREKAMDGTWRWVNTAKDERVASGTVQTAATATTWTFTPQDGGYYVVRAKAGGTVAETGIYVLGGSSSWARSDSKTLELVADKRSYEPGDTARILVKAPKKGMRALVTVEREGVWTRRVVTLASTSEAIEVPITAEMLPNAFVTVLAVEPAPPANTPDAGKPGIWYGVAPLTVSTKTQQIAVALTTDKEAYQPGDEVRIHLEAQRAGQRLANARVTLWAVDYGVLSLTAYETPDVHGTFYTARPLGVITADNRISVYDRAHYLSKGADVGGGGGDESDGDTRRRFETTPLWQSALRTDASGALDHRFILPDNLTTFRIMAVVDDGKAAFGKAEHEVRVNRPLIARPALPRFFREGDKVLAGVVVHNNTAAPVSVVVNALATGATLRGAPRTVNVEANGALEVPFSLTGFAAPSVTLRFEATGGGNKDAVEVILPVSSPLPQEVVATTGTTTSSVEEQVAIPDGANRTTGGLTVDVSATALVGMGSAVDYLLDYPHGCLEQVGSRTRVAMLAQVLREKAGIETSPKELDEYVRVGLSELKRFETPSGGFSYWPGGEASGPASAYALEVLSEAARGGAKVEPSTIDGLVSFVREFISGQHTPRWWSPETAFAARARAALSLARADRGDAAFNSRLWDGRRELPQHARAELLESMGRTTGGDSRTRTLTAELESAVHIEAASASLVDDDQGRWDALWYGDDLGTSAFVRALMQVQPAHPLLPRLASHLVSARTHGRWSNTYTTTEALAALKDYTAKFETGDVTARVALAGAPLLDRSLGAGGQAHTFVPMSGLQAGGLSLTGTGGRLYYETRLAYAVPNLPPRDEGFTVARTYEVLDGTGGGASVSPGAVVRVTLRAVTPVDRFNVALVDWLPAGLEPIDTSFATSARAYGGDTGGGWRPEETGIFAPDEPQEWVSTWVFNRRELRDDSVALYADYMPAGIHVQTYLARATTPGDYAHPAATVEEMYAPEVFGRTESGRFVVGWPVAARE
jgi:uncharacterized protein YfaS (alpha-2-macroglobulin family)